VGWDQVNWTSSGEKPAASSILDLDGTEKKT
jgi:hypothetical protein